MSKKAQEAPDFRLTMELLDIELKVGIFNGFTFDTIWTIDVAATGLRRCFKRLGFDLGLLKREAKVIYFNRLQTLRSKFPEKFTKLMFNNGFYADIEADIDDDSEYLSDNDNPFLPEHTFVDN